MIDIPTTCGHKDSKGTYCKWGSKGAHYYYTPGDKASMKRARAKADAQGAAVHSTGWHEKCEGCEIDEILEQAEIELANIKKSFEELKNLG